MRKSLFAGLTILEPDESILSDDGSFIGADRDTIDRFLEIGAKTHRHTGEAGLANPELPLPSVQAISSGGFINGDVTFVVGYTLVDGDGGETLISPTTSVTTAPPLSPPIQAPTAAIDYSAGALLVDTYYYALTYVDSEGGETPPGAWSSVEREPGFANARCFSPVWTTASRLHQRRAGGSTGPLAEGPSAIWPPESAVRTPFPTMAPSESSATSTRRPMRSTTPTA
jgi:hypothetical protein